MFVHPDAHKQITEALELKYFATLTSAVKHLDTKALSALLVASLSLTISSWATWQATVRATAGGTPLGDATLSEARAWLQKELIALAGALDDPQEYAKQRAARTNGRES